METKWRKGWKEKEMENHQGCLDARQIKISLGLKMFLGLVVMVIGDFNKRCGVMRLEARLQSTKEKVECEEIDTANTVVDNVIEIFVGK